MKIGLYMWLVEAIERARAQEILDSINMLFDGQDDSLGLLAELAEPYREDVDLVDFFWWLDYACADGYGAAELFFNEMHKGLGQAVTFFREMCN